MAASPFLIRQLPGAKVPFISGFYPHLPAWLPKGVDLLYPLFLIGPNARMPHPHNLYLEVVASRPLPSPVEEPPGRPAAPVEE